MRKYYLSVDGGGTKLSVILFNQNLYPCGFGRSGAVNPNFIVRKLIKRHFQESIDQCLGSVPPDAIDTLFITMPGPADLFAFLLRKKIPLRQVIKVSEGEMWLRAGIFKDRGIVALSGTGSGVFHVNGPHSSHLGGWGALVDDEGSGYAIGRMAISAAIKSYEKRDRPSMLEQAIQEKWQLPALRDLIAYLYQSDDYRGVIANLTLTVVEAARLGDPVAQAVLCQAGNDMASQVIALVRRDRLASDLPVMVAGSVWKGNPLMLKAFSDRLQQGLPDFRLFVPEFEAVIGGLVMAAADHNSDLEVTTSQIQSKYQAYRYQASQEYFYV